jgi:hypothetical protein
MAIKKMKEVPVLVDVPLHETNAAIQIIQRFKKKNNIDFELFVAYDFSMEEMGVYYYKRKNNQPFSKENDMRKFIFTNPLICKVLGESDESEVFYSGYCSDYTLFGVTIHEFCHYLQTMQYPKIIDEFIETFPSERFYINEYCNNEIRDEIAELMTLYIVNPMLLKLISIRHWKFFNQRFKSPIPCNDQKSFEIYEGFPIHVKKELSIKWGVTFNHKTRKFEKRQVKYNFDNEFHDDEKNSSRELHVA